MDINTGNVKIKKVKHIPRDSDGLSLKQRMNTVATVAQAVQMAVGAEGKTEIKDEGYVVEVVLSTINLTKAIDEAHKALMVRGFVLVETWDDWDTNITYHDYAKREFIKEDMGNCFGIDMTTYPKDLRTVQMSHNSYYALMDEGHAFSPVRIEVKHNQVNRERKV